jgi:hypothetical protein
VGENIHRSKTVTKQPLRERNGREREESEDVCFSDQRVCTENVKDETMMCIEIQISDTIS